MNDPEMRAAVRDNFAHSHAEALAAYSNNHAALYACLKLAGLEAAPVQLAVLADPDILAGMAWEGAAYLECCNILLSVPYKPCG